MLNVFRNEIFPQIPEFSNLRGHSRGNPRSDLIFMGGGGGTTYCVLERKTYNLIIV